MPPSRRRIRRSGSGPPGEVKSVMLDEICCIERQRSEMSAEESTIRCIMISDCSSSLEVLPAVERFAEDLQHGRNAVSCRDLRNGQLQDRGFPKAQPLCLRFPVVAENDYQRLLPSAIGRILLLQARRHFDPTYISRHST